MCSNVIFTICSAEMLPNAKILISSCRNYASAWHFVLCLAERRITAEQYQNLSELLEGVTILFPDELSLPDVNQMAFQYNAVEFNASLKPYVFSFLFKKGAQKIIYFAPAIELFQHIDIYELLECYDCIITPHITSPLPDIGTEYSNELILRGGQFDFSFVAFKHTEETNTFITWWANQLVYTSIAHSNHYYYLDQFHGSFVVSFIEKVKIIRGTNFNLTPTNICQRHLWQQDDIWRTDDGPLVFCHFLGCKQNLPNRQFHQNEAIFYEMCGFYNQKVLSCISDFSFISKLYSFATYEDGKRITDYDRRKFLFSSPEDKKTLPPPFSTELRRTLRDFTTSLDFALDFDGMLTILLQTEKDNKKLEEKCRQLTADNAALRDDNAALRDDNISNKNIAATIMDSWSFRLGNIFVAPLSALIVFIHKLRQTKTNC